MLEVGLENIFRSPLTGLSMVFGSWKCQYPPSDGLTATLLHYACIMLSINEVKLEKSEQATFFGYFVSCKCKQNGDGT